MNPYQTDKGISNLNLPISTRFVGFMFLFYTLTGIAHYSLIDANLLGKEDMTDVVTFIQSNELLFRTGIILDMLVFANAAVLALALYTLLKHVNTFLARVGLLLILMQVMLAIAIELSSYLALFLVKDVSNLSAFDSEQLLALQRLVVNVRGAGWSTGILFVNSGMILIMYLFYRSRLIPRLLSGWGGISLLLMLLGTALAIILPEVAKTTFRGVIVASSASVILFHIAIGVWLIVRKVSVKLDAGS